MTAAGQLSWPVSPECAPNYPHPGVIRASVLENSPCLPHSGVIRASVCWVVVHICRIDCGLCRCPGFVVTVVDGGTECAVRTSSAMATPYGRSLLSHTPWHALWDIPVGWNIGRGWTRGGRLRARHDARLDRWVRPQQQRRLNHDDADT